MRRLDNIRSEEYLRARYRKQFEFRAAAGSKVLNFANSGLGLFLLSTVFVSVFSWAFNNWTTHQKEALDADRTRHKLKIEIMNRIHYIDELKNPLPYNNYHIVENALDGFIPGAKVLPSHIPYYGAVFPEYQARSFLSLIWELESLSDLDTREKLRSARGPVEQVHQYIQKLQYTAIETPNRSPDGKLELLQLSDDDRQTFVTRVWEPLAFLRDPKFEQRR